MTTIESPKVSQQLCASGTLLTSKPTYAEVLLGRLNPVLVPFTTDAYSSSVSAVVQETNSVLQSDILPSTVEGPICASANSQFVSTEETSDKIEIPNTVENVQEITSQDIDMHFTSSVTEELNEFKEIQESSIDTSSNNQEIFSSPKTLVKFQQKTCTSENVDIKKKSKSSGGQFSRKEPIRTISESTTAVQSSHALTTSEQANRSKRSYADIVSGRISPQLDVEMPILSNKELSTVCEKKGEDKNIEVFPFNIVSFLVDENTASGNITFDQREPEMALDYPLQLDSMINQGQKSDHQLEDMRDCISCLASSEVIYEAETLETLGKEELNTFTVCSSFSDTQLQLNENSDLITSSKLQELNPLSLSSENNEAIYENIGKFNVPPIDSVLTEDFHQNVSEVPSIAVKEVSEEKSTTALHKIKPSYKEALLSGLNLGLQPSRSNYSLRSLTPEPYSYRETPSIPSHQYRQRSVSPNPSVTFDKRLYKQFRETLKKEMMVKEGNSVQKNKNNLADCFLRNIKEEVRHLCKDSNEQSEPLRQSAKVKRKHVMKNRYSCDQPEDKQIREDIASEISSNNVFSTCSLPIAVENNELTDDKKLPEGIEQKSTSDTERERNVFPKENLTVQKNVEKESVVSESSPVKQTGAKPKQRRHLSNVDKSVESSDNKSKIKRRSNSLKGKLDEAIKFQKPAIEENAELNQFNLEKIHKKNKNKMLSSCASDEKSESLQAAIEKLKHIEPISVSLQTGKTCEISVKENDSANVLNPMVVDKQEVGDYEMEGSDNICIKKKKKTRRSTKVNEKEVQAAAETLNHETEPLTGSSMKNQEPGENVETQESDEKKSVKKPKKKKSKKSSIVKEEIIQVIKISSALNNEVKTPESSNIDAHSVEKSKGHLDERMQDVKISSGGQVIDENIVTNKEVLQTNLPKDKSEQINSDGSIKAKKARKRKSKRSTLEINELNGLEEKIILPSTNDNSTIEIETSANSKDSDIFSFSLPQEERDYNLNDVETQAFNEKEVTKESSVETDLQNTTGNSNQDKKKKRKTRKLISSDVERALELKNITTLSATPSVTLSADSSDSIENYQEDVDIKEDLSHKMEVSEILFTSSTAGKNSSDLSIKNSDVTLQDSSPIQSIKSSDDKLYECASKAGFTISQIISSQDDLVSPGVEEILQPCEGPSSEKVELEWSSDNGSKYENIISESCITSDNEKMLSVDNKSLSISNLLFETVWFDKPLYEDAENSYYKMSSLAAESCLFLNSNNYVEDNKQLSCLDFTNSKEEFSKVEPGALVEVAGSSVDEAVKQTQLSSEHCKDKTPEMLLQEKDTEGKLPDGKPIIMVHGETRELEKHQKENVQKAAFVNSEISEEIKCSDSIYLYNLSQENIWFNKSEYEESESMYHKNLSAEILNSCEITTNKQEIVLESPPDKQDMLPERNLESYNEFAEQNKSSVSNATEIQQTSKIGTASNESMSSEISTVEQKEICSENEYLIFEKNSAISKETVWFDKSIYEAAECAWNEYLMKSKMSKINTDILESQLHPETLQHPQISAISNGDKLNAQHTEEDLKLSTTEVTEPELQSTDRRQRGVEQDDESPTISEGFQDLILQSTEVGNHQEAISSTYIKEKETFEDDVASLNSQMQVVEQRLTTSHPEIDVGMQLANVKYMQSELGRLQQQLTSLENVGKQLVIHIPELQPVISSTNACQSKLELLVSQAQRKESEIKLKIKEEQKQQKQIERYIILLQELEVWVKEMFSALSVSICITDIQSAEAQIKRHEEMEKDLIPKKEQLDSLIKECEELLPCPGIAHLVHQVYTQLTALKNAISEAEDVIEKRKMQLQEILKEAQQPVVHQSISPEKCVVVQQQISSSQPDTVHPQVDKSEIVTQGFAQKSEAIYQRSIQNRTQHISQHSVLMREGQPFSENMSSEVVLESPPQIACSSSTQQFVSEQDFSPEEETIVEEVDGVKRITVRRVQRIVRQQVVQHQVRTQRIQKRIVIIGGREVEENIDSPDSFSEEQQDEPDGDGSTTFTNRIHFQTRYQEVDGNVQSVTHHSSDSGRTSTSQQHFTRVTSVGPFIVSNESNTSEIIPKDNLQDQIPTLRDGVSRVTEISQSEITPSSNISIVTGKSHFKTDINISLTDSEQTAHTDAESPLWKSQSIEQQTKLSKVTTCYSTHDIPQQISYSDLTNLSVEDVSEVDDKYSKEPIAVVGNFQFGKSQAVVTDDQATVSMEQSADKIVSRDGSIVTNNNLLSSSSVLITDIDENMSTDIVNKITEDTVPTVSYDVNVNSIDQTAQKVTPKGESIITSPIVESSPFESIDVDRDVNVNEDINNIRGIQDNVEEDDRRDKKNSLEREVISIDDSKQEKEATPMLSEIVTVSCLLVTELPVQDIKVDSVNEKPTEQLVPSSLDENVVTLQQVEVQENQEALLPELISVESISSLSLKDENLENPEIPARTVVVAETVKEFDSEPNTNITQVPSIQTSVVTMKTHKEKEILDKFSVNIPETEIPESKAIAENKELQQPEDKDTKSQFNNGIKFQMENEKDEKKLDSVEIFIPSKIEFGGADNQSEQPPNDKSNKDEYNDSTIIFEVDSVIKTTPLEDVKDKKSSLEKEVISVHDSKQEKEATPKLSETITVSSVLVNELPLQDSRVDSVNEKPMEQVVTPSLVENVVTGQQIEIQKNQETLLPELTAIESISSLSMKDENLENPDKPATTVVVAETVKEFDRDTSSTDSPIASAISKTVKKTVKKVVTFSLQDVVVEPDNSKEVSFESDVTKEFPDSETENAKLIEVEQSFFTEKSQLEDDKSEPYVSNEEIIPQRDRNIPSEVIPIISSDEQQADFSHICGGFNKTSEIKPSKSSKRTKAKPQPGSPGDDYYSAIDSTIDSSNTILDIEAKHLKTDALPDTTSYGVSLHHLDEQLLDEQLEQDTETNVEQLEQDTETNVEQLEQDTETNVEQKISKKKKKKSKQSFKEKNPEVIRKTVLTDLNVDQTTENSQELRLSYSEVLKGQKQLKDSDFEEPQSSIHLQKLIKRDSDYQDKNELENTLGSVSETLPEENKSLIITQVHEEERSIESKEYPLTEDSKQHQLSRKKKEKSKINDFEVPKEKLENQVKQPDSKEFVEDLNSRKEGDIVCEKEQSSLLVLSGIKDVKEVSKEITVVYHITDTGNEQSKLDEQKANIKSEYLISTPTDVADEERLSTEKPTKKKKRKQRKSTEVEKSDVLTAEKKNVDQSLQKVESLLTESLSNKERSEVIQVIQFHNEQQNLLPNLHVEKETVSQLPDLEKIQDMSSLNISGEKSEQIQDASIPQLMKKKKSRSHKRSGKYEIQSSDISGSDDKNIAAAVPEFDNDLNKKHDEELLLATTGITVENSELQLNLNESIEIEKTRNLKQDVLVSEVEMPAEIDEIQETIIAETIPTENDSCINGIVKATVSESEFEKNIQKPVSNEIADKENTISQIATSLQSEMQTILSEPNILLEDLKPSSDEKTSYEQGIIIKQSSVKKQKTSKPKNVKGSDTEEVENDFKSKEREFSISVCSTAPEAEVKLTKESLDAAVDNSMVGEKFVISDDSNSNLSKHKTPGVKDEDLKSTNEKEMSGKKSSLKKKTKKSKSKPAEELDVSLPKETASEFSSKEIEVNPVVEEKQEKNSTCVSTNSNDIEIIAEEQIEEFKSPLMPLKDLPEDSKAAGDLNKAEASDISDQSSASLVLSLPELIDGKTSKKKKKKKQKSKSSEVLGKSDDKDDGRPLETKIEVAVGSEITVEDVEQFKELLQTSPLETNKVSSFDDSVETDSVKISENIIPQVDMGEGMAPSVMNLVSESVEINLSEDDDVKSSFKKKTKKSKSKHSKELEGKTPKEIEIPAQLKESDEAAVKQKEEVIQISVDGKMTELSDIEIIEEEKTEASKSFVMSVKPLSEDYAVPNDLKQKTVPEIVDNSNTTLEIDLQVSDEKSSKKKKNKLKVKSSELEKSDELDAASGITITEFVSSKEFLKYPTKESSPDSGLDNTQDIKVTTPLFDSNKECFPIISDKDNASVEVNLKEEITDDKSSEKKKMKKHKLKPTKILEESSSEPVSEVKLEEEASEVTADITIAEMNDIEIIKEVEASSLPVSEKNLSVDSEVKDALKVINDQSIEPSEFCLEETDKQISSKKKKKKQQTKLTEKLVKPNQNDSPFEEVCRPLSTTGMTDTAAIISVTDLEEPKESLQLSTFESLPVSQVELIEERIPAVSDQERTSIEISFKETITDDKDNSIQTKNLAHEEIALKGKLTDMKEKSQKEKIKDTSHDLADDKTVQINDIVITPEEASPISMKDFSEDSGVQDNFSGETVVEISNQSCLPLKVNAQEVTDKKTPKRKKKRQKDQQTEVQKSDQDGTTPEEVSLDNTKTLPTTAAISETAVTELERLKESDQHSIKETTSIAVRFEDTDNLAVSAVTVSQAQSIKESVPLDTDHDNISDIKENAQKEKTKDTSHDLAVDKAFEIKDIEIIPEEASPISVKDFSEDSGVHDDFTRETKDTSHDLAVDKTFEIKDIEIIPEEASPVSIKDFSEDSGVPDDFSRETLIDISNQSYLLSEVNLQELTDEKPAKKKKKSKKDQKIEVQKSDQDGASEESIGTISEIIVTALEQLKESDQHSTTLSPSVAVVDRFEDTDSHEVSPVTVSQAQSVKENVPLDIDHDVVVDVGLQKEEVDDIVSSRKKTKKPKSYYTEKLPLKEVSLPEDVVSKDKSKEIDKKSQVEKLKEMSQDSINDETVEINVVQVIKEEKTDIPKSLPLSMKILSEDSSVPEDFSQETVGEMNNEDSVHLGQKITDERPSSKKKKKRQKVKQPEIGNLDTYNVEISNPEHSMEMSSTTAAISEVTVKELEQSKDRSVEIDSLKLSEINVSQVESIQKNISDVKDQDSVSIEGKFSKDVTDEQSFSKTEKSKVKHFEDLKQSHGRSEETESQSINEIKEEESEAIQPSVDSKIVELNDGQIIDEKVKFTMPLPVTVKDELSDNNDRDELKDNSDQDDLNRETTLKLSDQTNIIVEFKDKDDEKVSSKKKKKKQKPKPSEKRDQKETTSEVVKISLDIRETPAEISELEQSVESFQLSTEIQANIDASIAESQLHDDVSQKNLEKEAVAQHQEEPLELPADDRAAQLSVLNTTTEEKAQVSPTIKQLPENVILVDDVKSELVLVGVQADKSEETDFEKVDVVRKQKKKLRSRKKGEIGDLDENITKEPLTENNENKIIFQENKTEEVTSTPKTISVEELSENFASQDDLNKETVSTFSEQKNILAEKSPQDTVDIKKSSVKKQKKRSKPGKTDKLETSDSHMEIDSKPNNETEKSVENAEVNVETKVIEQPTESIHSVDDLIAEITDIPGVLTEKQEISKLSVSTILPDSLQYETNQTTKKVIKNEKEKSTIEDTVNSHKQETEMKNLKPEKSDSRISDGIIDSTALEQVSFISTLDERIDSKSLSDLNIDAPDQALLLVTDSEKQLRQDIPVENKDNVLLNESQVISSSLSDHLVEQETKKGQSENVPLAVSHSVDALPESIESPDSLIASLVKGISTESASETPSNPAQIKVSELLARTITENLLSQIITSTDAVVNNDSLKDVDQTEINQPQDGSLKLKEEIEAVTNQEATKPEDAADNQWARWEAFTTQLNHQTERLQHARRGSLIPTYGQIEVGTTLEERKSKVEDLINKLPRTFSLECVSEIQQIYLVVTQTITEWIEIVQYNIYLIEQKKTTEIGTQDYEKFKEELAILTQQLNNLQQNYQLVHSNLPEELKFFVKDIIQKLSNQIQEIEYNIHDRQEQILLCEQQKHLYLEEVNEITLTITVLLERFTKICQIKDSILQQLTEIEELDQCVMLQLQKLSDVYSKGENLLQTFPGIGELPSLSTSRASLLQLQHQVRRQRDYLVKAVGLKEQYEKLLAEFAQLLETADIKLQTELTAETIEQLNKELDQHKDFFASIHQCHTVLDSLAEAADPVTRAQWKDFHKQQQVRASNVLDKASHRGQLLEHLISEKTLLDKRMVVVEKQIESLVTCFPEVTDLEADAVEPHIIAHQGIISELNEIQSQLEQLKNIINHLHFHMNVTSTQCQLEKLYLQWYTQKEKIEENIQLLYTTRDIWKTYDQLRKELDHWLTESLQESKVVRIHLSEVVNNKISANLHLILKLWMLRSSLDRQQKNHERILIYLEQLFNMTVLNKSIISTARKSISDKWNQLKKTVEGNEKLLSQIPWASLDVNNLYAEFIEMEKHSTPIEKLSSDKDLQQALDEYQDLKGAYNQILSTGSKTEGYSGEIEIEGRSAAMKVANQLKTVQLLHQQHQNQLSSNKSLKLWFEGIQKKITELHSSLGLNKEAAELTLKDCQNLAAELERKKDFVKKFDEVQMKLMSTEQGAFLIDCLKHPFTPVSEQLESLQLQNDNLKSALENRIEHWDDFDSATDAVCQCLSEMEYTLSQYTVPAVEVQAFQAQIIKLKDLADQTKQKSVLLETLSLKGKNLAGESVPATAENILSKVNHLTHRWTENQNILASQLTKLESALQIWQLFTEEFNQLQFYLDDCELKFESQLISVPHSPEDLAAYQVNCDTLKSNVENLKIKCDHLVDLKNQIQEEQFIAKAVKAHLPEEVEFLLQKQSTLLVEIAVYVNRINEEVKDIEKCKEIMRTLDLFLDKVQETIYGKPFGPKSDFQANVKNTQELLDGYVNLEPSVTTLRELQGRVLLDQPTKEQLMSILQTWSKIYADLLQYHQKQLSDLILSQHFEQKLTTWSSLLKEPKQNFKSSSDYDRRVQNLKQIEVSQTILAGQQPLLSDPVLTSENISQGQLQKLKSLDTDYSCAMQKTAEQYTALRTQVDEFQKYQLLTNKLSKWLKTMEREKEQLRLKHAPIKKIDNIQKKIECLLAKMNEGESLLNEIQSCKCSQITSERHFMKQLSNLKAGLATWQNFLQHVWSMWNNVERVVSDLHSELMNVRIIFTNKIPFDRKGILEQQQIFKDVNEKLNSIASQLEQLNQREEELRDAVSPADMKLLHHRCLLLHHLLLEMQHELTLRQHLLNSSLNHRTKLNEQLKSLRQWINNMHLKLERTSELCLETMINNFGTVYKNEIEKKADDYQASLVLGENLLKTVSDDEAREIQNQLTDLTNQWNELNSLRIRRLTKFQEILKLLEQLDILLAELKLWLSQTESHLNTPICFQSGSLKEINEIIDQFKHLEVDIDNHRSNVDSVLNLCHQLQQDYIACSSPRETEEVSNVIINLNQQWENIEALRMQRKTWLENTRVAWEELIKMMQQFETWLTNTEKLIEMPNIKTIPLTNVKEELQKFEGLQKNIEENFSSLDPINKKYRLLAREGQTDCNKIMYCRIEKMKKQWDELHSSVQETVRQLRAIIFNYDEYRNLHQTCVNWLASTDQQLSDIEHFSEEGLAVKLKKLQTLELEFNKRTEELERVSHLGENLIDGYDKNIVLAVSQELDEYKSFYEMVRERFQRLKLQFSELALKDSSVQVDTLPPETLQHQIIIQESESCLEVKAAEPEESKTDLYFRNLEAALEESQQNLITAESTLRSPTPVTFESNQSPIGYAHQVASCRSSIDLVQHLSNLIQQEVGLPQAISVTPAVEGIIQRWTLVEAQALEKERRLKDSHKQWQQFLIDMAAMEDWLTKAEQHSSTLQTSVERFDQLETTIQLHRDFLLDLDSHKAMVLSLNLSGQQIIEKASNEEQIQQVQDRLKILNSRWEHICRHIASHQTQLQIALLECHEFNDTVQELLYWLEATEASIRQTEPVDLSAERSTISSKYNKFLELKADLERCEPRILSLQQTAEQLLLHTDSAEGLATKEKLELLATRLHCMLELCTVYIQKLARILEAQNSYLDGISPEEFQARMETIQADNARSEVEEEEEYSVLNRCCHFLGRVVKASLPIQALMLLLLGVASLVPISEQDYSCALTNNFAKSFEPMLRYANGPPPV